MVPKNQRHIFKPFPPPSEKRSNLYLHLLDQFPFTAVSIGTRPDCITPQALDFLYRTNRHIEVWVELGVQTIHDATLERVNRGHNWASSERAIELLHQANISIALHAILGLPGETSTDFFANRQPFCSTAHTSRKNPQSSY